MQPRQESSNRTRGPPQGGRTTLLLLPPNYTARGKVGREVGVAPHLAKPGRGRGTQIRFCPLCPWCARLKAALHVIRKMSNSNCSRKQQIFHNYLAEIIINMSGPVIT